MIAGPLDTPVCHVVESLVDCLNGTLGELPDHSEDFQRLTSFHQRQAELRDQFASDIQQLRESIDKLLEADEQNKLEARVVMYQWLISLEEFLGVLCEPSSGGQKAALSDLYTRVLHVCGDPDWGFKKDIEYTVLPGNFDKAGQPLVVNHCAADFLVSAERLVRGVMNEFKLVNSLRKAVNGLLVRQQPDTAGGAVPLVRDLGKAFVYTLTKDDVAKNFGLTDDQIQDLSDSGNMLFGEDALGRTVYPSFQFVYSATSDKPGDTIDGLVVTLLRRLGRISELQSAKAGKSALEVTWGIVYWVYGKWAAWNDPERTPCTMSSYVTKVMKRTKTYERRGVTKAQMREMTEILKNELPVAGRYRTKPFKGARQLYRVIWSGNYWCRYSQRWKDGETGRFTLSRKKWAGTLYLSEEPQGAIAECLGSGLVIGLKDIVNRSLVTITWTFPESFELIDFGQAFIGGTRQDASPYKNLRWQQAQILGDLVFENSIHGIKYSTTKSNHTQYALFGSGPYPTSTSAVEAVLENTMRLVRSPDLWAYLDSILNTYGGDPDCAYLGRYPDDIRQVTRTRFLDRADSRPD